jgi:Tol biopolymer transport system component
LTSLFFQCSKIVVIVSVLSILLARFIGNGRQASGDLLAYRGRGVYSQKLMLYDVNNRMKVPIFITSGHFRFDFSKNQNFAYSLINNGMIEIAIVRNFQAKTVAQTPTTQQFPYSLSWSPDGRYLAFGSPHEDDISEIYLLDTEATDQQAVKITQMPTTGEILLGWSPDGQYLTLESHQDDERLLYVWDGKTIINITPENMPEPALSYTLDWSDDGLLAITVNFGYASGDTQEEVYLWDGNKTISLSQNPNGEDHRPVWNIDGHLAFLSHRDGIYNILGWDGQSFKDGLPDIQPLIHDPSGFIGYISYPGWTPDGLLTFTSQTAADTNTQIYVWDGQKATNISQNPTLHNGGPVWSDDGRWAFVTFFSSQQLLYVRDANNNPLITTGGEYKPAWSPIGNLAFCVRNEFGWTISVWDGQTIIEITQGNDISARWSNGNSVSCSSG